MTDEMTTKPGQPETSGKPGIRWGRIVLVVSLGLNLAVLGIVGGAVLRRDAGMDRARALQARDFGFGPFVGAFDTGDRRLLGREFSRSAGDPATARKEVGEMFETMVATLKAEPFDAEAFEVLLLTQQKDFSDRQEIGAKLVVDRIEAMTPEARRAYAERLDQMLKRPPPPHPGEPRGEKPAPNH